MDELGELLEMASSGDENALKTLNLDKPVKLTLDKPYANVGIIRLTGEYEATRAMIAAAERLKLWTLAASCRNKLKYLQFIAKEFCKTTLANKPIPRETIDVMKYLLDEIDVKRQQIEGEKKAAESDSETEMVSRKSDEKKGEKSERKEGQSASSVKDTDKEMEVEYGKEPRSLERKSSEMEGESQILSSDGDIVEKLVEDKEEGVSGKDKERKQEQKGQSKTGESSSPFEGEDKGAGTIKGKEGKNPAKKLTVNNSKVRKCPLCKANITHLRRHVVTLHVNTEERLAISQLESILQAAIHGEEKRGKERLEKRLGKKVSFKGRVREKCPLCDKAVLALTTHLQRTHKLKKDDSIYKSAMRIVQPYKGKTKEVKSCKRKAEDQPKVSHVKKRPLTPLGVLIQEVDVESDEKDSDYVISSDDECHNLSESSDSAMIIPPPPVKRESLMLKASLVKRRITKENFSDERDVVEENDNIEDEQHEDKGSDDEKEDEYDSLQDEEEEVPEDDIGDEEWQQWAVKEFYKGRPKGFRHQLLKYFYEHLQDLGGGANKERQAGIHAQNV